MRMTLKSGAVTDTVAITGRGAAGDPQRALFHDLLKKWLRDKTGYLQDFQGFIETEGKAILAENDRGDIQNSSVWDMAGPQTAAAQPSVVTVDRCLLQRFVSDDSEGPPTREADRLPQFSFFVRHEPIRDPLPVIPRIRDMENPGTSGAKFSGYECKVYQTLHQRLRPLEQETPRSPHQTRDWSVDKDPICLSVHISTVEPRSNG